MSNTIHGRSHQAIKAFRQQAAALEVYWIYCARASNKDNVAWPTVRGLANDTEFNKDTCGKARRWLVEHGVLEPVEGYIRPQWRNLSPKELAQKLNFDKAEYFRPTGTITIDNETYPLLYFEPGEETDEFVDETTDVRPGRTSGEAGCPTGPDVSPGRTELNTSKRFQDSTNTESSNDDSSKTPAQARVEDETPQTPSKESASASDEPEPDPPIEPPKRRKQSKPRPRNLRGDVIAYYAWDVPKGTPWPDDKGFAQRMGRLLKDLDQKAEIGLLPRPLTARDLANGYEHNKATTNQNPPRGKDTIMGMMLGWFKGGELDYFEEDPAAQYPDERVPASPVPKGRPMQQGASP